MTSPSSSSAASPFSGPGLASQTAPQASTPLATKASSAKEQSFLEVIPVTFPTIVPLEWSFPLIYRAKPEQGDLGGLKVDSSNALSSADGQASAVTNASAPTPSLQPPSSIPAYLAAETPVSLPIAPSPASSAALPATGQVINQIQKPWRIRWAVYKVKGEYGHEELLAAASPVHGRAGKASAISTPHNGLLQVPQVYAHSPLMAISPSGSIFGKVKSKARSRAASDASQRSRTSRSSNQSRQKKRRTHGHDAILTEGESPQAILRAFYGEERQAEYRRIIESLTDQKKASSVAPLMRAKKQFLKYNAASAESHTTQDLLPDEITSSEHDSVIKHGLLPERLAVIDRAWSPTHADGDRHKTTDLRLYTFWLTSPTLGLSDYSDPDEGTAFPDLESEGSGTFTASDLFPTLYNDNGIYTPPSSMHPASVHPIPSAAALGAGQNGSFGKVPFFLSSLNISSSSNKEAVAASDAFLKAVEEHVLGAIRESYDPAASTTVHDAHPNTATPQKKRAKAVRCGHGILYPSSASAKLQIPTQLRCEEESHATVDRSVFVSCTAHFSAADVRVSAHMESSNLRATARTSSPIDAGPHSPKARRISDNHLRKGQLVLLCPMSLPAVFIRYYGRASDKVSPRQALSEAHNIKSIESEIRELSDEQLFPGTSDALWLLCTVGEGLQVIWPASLALLTSDRAQKEMRKCSYRQKTLSTRIKSSLAKASPRIPRGLYFQRRPANTSKLVTTSLSYIEQQNSLRAKERREKAEKTLKGGETEMLAESGIRDQAPTSPDDAYRARSRMTQVESAKLPDTGDPLGILNAFGCPTFESMASALDKLAGPEAATPASIIKQPLIRIDDVNPSQGTRSEESNHDTGLVYPTPQSGPNSTNQMFLDGPDTAEVASTAINPQSPRQAGNRSFADIFQDFSWPSYTDTALAVSRHTPSRPNSSAGRPKGVFDDPSTFDLFDSAGLTEEDFSFFDSPIPANILEGNPMAIDAFAQDTEVNDLHAITVDDLASFVQSGPVDHFGHLMPRGTSNALKLSVRDENFEALEDYKLPDTHIPQSPHELAIPLSGIAQITDPARSSSLAVECNKENLFGGPAIDNPHESTIGLTVSKYDLSMSAPNAHNALVPRIIAVGDNRGAEGPQTSFRSVQFYIRSHPHSDEKLELRENPVASWCRDEYLEQEKATRAVQLKRSILKSNDTPSPPSTTQCMARAWQEDRRLLAAISESSSATNSDDDDRHSIESELAFEPERSRVPSNIITVPTANIFSLTIDLCEVPPNSSGQPAATSELPRDGPPKVNRGEREAIATIFFQHTIENIDYRERQKCHYSKATRSLSLSTMQPMLPNATLSKKITSAHTTDMDVIRQQAVTKLSVSALKSWLKLGLRPHNGSKDIQAVVVTPKLLLDNTTTLALQDWLHSIASAWEHHGFGAHTSGPVEECLFPLDCESPHLSQSTNWQAQLTSISGDIASRIAGEHSCVIYVLIDDSECETPHTSLMYLCLRLHLLRKGAIPHVVPLSALSNANQCMPWQDNAGPHHSAIGRFVFNVYDRVPACVTRYCKDKTGPNSVSALLPELSAPGGHLMRAFMAPAFHLVPRSSPHIALQLQWPPPSLEVLDANRLFHIGYEISDDSKWLYLAAIDDRAEYHCLRVRFIENLDTKVVLRRVWNFTKEASESAAVQWRICISRVGTMPVAEVQAWCEILQTLVPQSTHPAMVTVLSVQPAFGTLSERYEQTKLPPNIPGQLSGITLPTAPDTVHAEGTVRAFIAHSPYPTAVYKQPVQMQSGLPVPRDRLYYALASTSVYFPEGALESSLSANAARPSSSSYSIDLLIAATHPLSTYNRQLASHMAEVAQSFVDMRVLARERWAFGAGEAVLSAFAHLPWHLQAVMCMPAFDIEALLPS